MNVNAKKTFSIIFVVIFLIFNLMHIIWPIQLIIEDIKAKTMYGTGIEMAFLFPFFTELLSAPFVIAEIVYYIVFRKVKYFDKANFIIFVTYIFQVILFYFLLSF